MSLYNGLYIKASAVPDLNVNYAEGLIMTPTSGVPAIAYVPAGLKLITVAATKGKSTSASSPATTATALSLSVNIDGDGAQAIVVDDGGTHTGAAIAAAIQVAIRALTANNSAHQASINAVTATFTNSLYVVTSGSTGSGSSVVITGAGAVNLKLGVANGGTEIVGINQVTPASTENVGIAQINDSTGVISLKWGTPVASSSGLAQYPSPDAGNLLLAKLFTPAAPITPSTTSIANANINNLILNSSFGGR